MKAIVLFSLLFLSARISAQEIPKVNFTDSVALLDDEIFVGDPATQAEYPGGYIAMMKFIQENLVIPKLSNNDTINGKVLLRFMVTKTGDLTNASVAKGIDNCKECSQEALNLLEKFPKWNPAEIFDNQKKEWCKIDQWFTLPVLFKNY
jgi:TonB family protein